MDHALLTRCSGFSRAVRPLAVTAAVTGLDLCVAFCLLPTGELFGMVRVLSKYKQQTERQRINV